MPELAAAGSAADIGAPHVCLLCLMTSCSSLAPATGGTQVPIPVLSGLATARPPLDRRPHLPRPTGRAPPETGRP
jgi:hypothetical protein